MWKWHGRKQHESRIENRGPYLVHPEGQSSVCTFLPLSKIHDELVASDTHISYNTHIVWSLCQKYCQCFIENGPFCIGTVLLHMRMCKNMRKLMHVFDFILSFDVYSFIYLLCISAHVWKKSIWRPIQIQCLIYLYIADRTSFKNVERIHIAEGNSAYIVNVCTSKWMNACLMDYSFYICEWVCEPRRRIGLLHFGV